MSSNGARTKKGSLAADFDVFANVTPPRSAAAGTSDPSEAAEPPPEPPAAAGGADAKGSVPASRSRSEAARERPLDLEAVASRIPAPSGTGATGELTVGERDKLAQCERVLGLSEMFWAAVGLSLRTIRDDDLTRDQFPNFDAYCRLRWDLGRRRVDQLIQASPLGMAVGVKHPNIVNERQIRMLLPYEDDHGRDAAVAVYDAIAAAARPSATLIKAVLAGLPGEFDAEKIAGQVRKIVAEAPRFVDPPARPEVERDDRGEFVVQVDRWQRMTREVAALAAADPERARVFVADLRKLADEVEQGSVAG